jgi:hypothetical protein
VEHLVASEPARVAGHGAVCRLRGSAGARALPAPLPRKGVPHVVVHARGGAP